MKRNGSHQPHDHREAMSSGSAILSLDASNDQRFDSSQSIADFSIKSMICAPLIDSDGEAFGALQIDSTEGRGQSEMKTWIYCQASLAKRQRDPQCSVA